jgi:uncharacterized protein YutD
MVKVPGMGKKWEIMINLIPIIIGIILLKYVFHFLGWEVISLTALFTSIVAGAIFLLGFLIAGVMTDYKEGERLPGELACSLEAIYDEASILDRFKRTQVTQDFMIHHLDLVIAINDWFHRKVRTKDIMERISRMNDYFYEFEAITQANFIARIKQEQSAVRRIITRVHTIRETSFVQSGYAVVEILAIILIVGLLLLKLEPWYESLFVVGAVSFIILYMLFLIKDLDNPFDYTGDGERGTEVSLKPIQDLIERLKAKD